MNHGCIIPEAEKGRVERHLYCACGARINLLWVSLSEETGIGGRRYWQREQVFDPAPNIGCLTCGRIMRSRISGGDYEVVDKVDPGTLL
jgi:hypothetical protein